MGTYFGWEANDLNATGMSVVYQVAGSGTIGGAGLTITGIEVSVSCARQAGVIGLGEVLAYGLVTGAGTPSFSAPSYQCSSLVSSPYIDSGTAECSGTLTYGLGGVEEFFLFSFILKETLASGDQSNLQAGPIWIPQNNLYVPAGGNIVLHMDHAGAGPYDCEMQGIIQGVLPNGTPF